MIYRLIKEENQIVFFDDDYSKKYIYYWEGNRIVLNKNETLKYLFQGGNLGIKNMEALKNQIGLGRYSNAPCSGFPNFYSYRVEDEEVIFYLGILEKSNSRFQISLHALFQRQK